MKKQKIRYAVVGIGHIAQVAVLPAFKHASKNSELTAIVSSDIQKHRAMKRKYKVETYTYDQYDQLLRSGTIDAVYIALPNDQHADYALPAAEAGIHILCEKPLAVTEEECRHMIEAAAKNKVKLMTAYRLHFEEANMKAVKIAQSGKLGKLRFFNSVFSMQVRKDNIRTEKEMGGGTLYDIGIYCINAARYLFQDEPYEVFAQTATSSDPRFKEVEEMASVIMRFPDDRLASFTTSFGAHDVSQYQIVGTKGNLCVDPAYEYAMPLEHHLTIGEKTTSKTFPQRDQFAPELIYFSDCILKNKQPEPSGQEGLADVRIIKALYLSAATGKPIPIAQISKSKRAEVRQVITRPAVKKPEMVHAKPASGGP
jgi:predicted dehydrogenase